MALKATKDAIRRVGEMTYDNAEDYLVRAQEAANSFDNDGRKKESSSSSTTSRTSRGSAPTTPPSGHSGVSVAVDTGSGARFSAGVIERLLKPHSIAIVGASATPGALGASVIANLDRMQFRGDIHLINPKRAEIGGRPCLASIDELPFGVDAAVLAIPRAAVLDAVQALARRGWAPLSSSPRGSPKPAPPVVPSRKSLTALAHEAGC